jgi:hypothetical protein
MNNLQKIKEEARKEFDEKWKMNLIFEYDKAYEIPRNDDIKVFIDSIITKAYEKGKKEITDVENAINNLI